jgi:hypothetical protein
MGAARPPRVAGRQALGAGVGGQARLDGPLDQFIHTVGKQPNVPNRHGSQSHDRAVAGCMFGGVAGSTGIAGLLEPAQGGYGRVADVEAAAVDRILPLFPPPHVSLGLIVQVPADLGDAVGQGERHTGVVRPFARCQTVRTAAPVAGHRLECARVLKLDGRAQGIADGQAEEGSALTVDLVHVAHCGYQSWVQGYFTDFVGG